MKNFEYYTPTKAVFGRGAEKRAYSKGKTTPNWRRISSIWRMSSSVSAWGISGHSSAPASMARLQDSSSYS